MSRNLSAGVTSREIDLSTTIAGGINSAAGTVGIFQWGPINDLVLVSNEENLLKKFGKPTINNNQWWFSAMSFLAYTDTLWLVRAASSSVLNAAAFETVKRFSVDGGTTSVPAGSVATIPGTGTFTFTSNGSYTFTVEVGFTGDLSVEYTLNTGAKKTLTLTVVDETELVGTVDLISGPSVQIMNDDDWERRYSSGEASIGCFAARFAGTMGNSIRISIADSASYDTWEFRDLFDSAPGTSDFAFERGGSNDEMHIVVVDQNGVFTGFPGTILDSYAYVSKGVDAKSSDGSSSYYKNVIVQTSSYVHWMDHISAENIGSSVVGTAFGDINGGSVYDVQFTGGVDDYAGTDDGEIQKGWDLFKNSETVDVTLAFAGPASKLVQQYVIDNVAEFRKDLLFTISPPLASVRGSDVAKKVVEAKNDPSLGVNRSTSYATMDCNWKMMFDKYNEQNVWVPCNPDIAGLCAQTDVSRDPWFSPAGFERGILKNVIKFAWNPDKTDRDILYKNGINPVLNIPGQGPVLYGDKTMLTRPSAFDRINVRRLFIVLKKAISNSAKYSLFELNDVFTRAQFVNMVVPYLRDVQARRGLYDFKVICDETNNTPEVIDRNEFIGTILLKPAKSINFITLNFVATRTGVDFGEVAGAV